jgi:hypothetical protein
MTQTASSALLRGGLNLVTPPLAIPAGTAIACINYEPDVGGYTSSPGFERFDGRDRPSDSSDPVEIATRRTNIQPVPGTGPVRGVQVFDGLVYAFRDQDAGTGGMFKSSSGGWVEITPGYVVFFNDGGTAFLEALEVVGGTSGAVGTIDRVVLQDGAWDGTAQGYLVVSGLGDMGNDSYTKVLLHFDGVDASTTFTDSNRGGSAHTWTAAGNAQIDTAQSVFGGASGLFDGVGDYTSTPDHADFALGSSDFTIELNFRINGSDGVQIYFAGQGDAAFSAAGTSFILYRSAAGNVHAAVSNGTTYTILSTPSLYTTASNPGWHHLEFSRSGNFAYLFIDGVLAAGPGAFSGSVPDVTNVLLVGGAGGSGSGVFNGWIDEFRLSVGIARHTAAFTVPTVSYGNPFFVGEVLTDSEGGTAEVVSFEQIEIPAGGRYTFTNHNFYGGVSSPRMYFASGVGRAHEWSGSWLAPIYSGVSAGTGGTYSFVLADNGDFLIADNGDFIILSAEFDQPSFIEHYKNHLFLGFANGSLVNSSIGEPLEYISTTGAAEVSFGSPITGLLTAASTSLMIFGSTRMEYITGNNADDFNMLPLNDRSGAVAYTAQMMDSPTYLDDAGIRQASATSAFGDWRMGTLTQPIEPLIASKRKAGITALASVTVKAKDQYKLFYDDGSGVTLYTGTKNPEAMPFKLPIDVLCSCAGEIDAGLGERIFVGCQDGYVYELNAGTSFDGEPIPTYIRLPFNSMGTALQDKAYKKSTLELDAPDPVTFGVKFDIDYGKGIGGGEVAVAALAGTALITTELYDSIIWSTPVQSRLEHHIAGLGPNIAVTYITEHDDKRPHTLAAQSFNFSPRKMRR